MQIRLYVDEDAMARALIWMTARGSTQATTPLDR
jgi:hypothetical protein